MKSLQCHSPHKLKTFFMSKTNCNILCLVINNKATIQAERLGIQTPAFPWTKLFAKSAIMRAALSACLWRSNGDYAGGAGG